MPVVSFYRPAGMPAVRLEAGYRRAYRDFYRWGSILRGSATHLSSTGRLRHAAYAVGWKKLEPLWDWIIRARRVGTMLPVLEALLEGRAPRLPEVELGSCAAPGEV